MPQIKNKPKLSTADRLRNYFSVLKEHELIEFEMMLNKGDTIPEIVKRLQDQWGYFKDISARTLEDKLSAYNTHVLKPKMLAVIDDIDVYKETLAMVEKIDVVKEFSVLLMQQKIRVERILKIERFLNSADTSGKSKDISAAVRKEIKIMGDLLEKVANLQLETGLLRRAPKVISGEFIGDDKDPKSIKFNITEQFISTLDQIAKEFNLDPDAITVEDKELLPPDERAPKDTDQSG